MTTSFDLAGDATHTLRDLLSPGAVVPILKSRTKKQALQDIAEIAARGARVDANFLFEALLQRERLGSTGIGRGVAVPHARLPQATHISMVFARLEHPIPFESVDDEPVDLLMLLISPEHAGGDHLKVLARVARLMRNPAITARLRSTRDKQTLFSILTEPLTQDAA
jgi:nitrogen PTS system EIIA component